MNSNETNSTSCCTVELGTKVFAYFNLVLVSVSTLISLIAFVYLSIYLRVILPSANKEQTDPLLSVQMAIAAISLFFFATGLVFAVFLFCGVRKQKPEYIKAYFVYGVIVVMLSLLSAIVFQFGGSVFGLIIGVSAYFVCVLHSFILLKIRKMYRKYETLHSQLEDKDLKEKV